MKKNTEKCALVTGGTSGIGYELAKLFAKDGYDLVIVARDENELSQTAEELKQQFAVHVTTLAKDLFKTETSQEIYDEVKAKGLHVNVLVNNAGQGEYGFFEEVDIQRHLDIIQLNVVAPVYLTKLFLKDMIAAGEGKILNLASIVSKTPTPLIGVYSATKAFMYSFSQSLRNEVKEKNITVTALLPGATDTDFFNKAGMLNTIEYHENANGDPADVAKDGYEALMKGEDHVVSGLKNKIMAAQANVMPDPLQTKNMREKHMRNIDGTEGKEGASESEGMRQAASNPTRDDGEARKPDTGRDSSAR
ncbi:MAG: Estradiol 17-beta-dehydrogenase [Flavipsychrobacter sp.]|jgi:short-subunit dehydrogenase|nr:Estradiol 17-beta-dehydrogenase [Flavipsychrobacter sp.]